MSLNDVDIDQKISEADKPETAPQSEAVQDTASVEKTPTEAQALFDLSKAEKFLFKGKEMTLTDIEKSMLRQDDYTKKTQSLAEERKYYDNLPTDIEAVKRNPSLISEFKKIYPEKYHRFIDVLGLTEQKQEGARPQTAELPREYLERLNRIEQSVTEREKEMFNAKLESIESGLTKRYGRANLTDVYGAADTFFRENNIQPSQLDEKMLEPFFKASHEYNVQQFKAWQQEELKLTKENNDRASDIGKGGGTPGQAPKKMRLKDVDDHIVSQENW
jgi:hypothetical protein